MKNCWYIHSSVPIFKKGRKSDRIDENVVIFVVWSSYVDLSLESVPVRQFYAGKNWRTTARTWLFVYNIVNSCE